MSRREWLLAGAVLAIGIALLPAVGGGVLWTHPLWLDELCCTIYPTEHATSPVGVVANIAHRQDFAPPLLHLIVWTVARAAGGMTPVILRSIALVCVSLALILVYAALRRRFAIVPSAAGALAIASHPLVLTHAFEGRFYGPWLLFAVAFAWSLGQPGRRGTALQAVFAVCVVLMHWFGVISLAIMCAGAWASGLARGERGLLAARALWPAASGVVALAACIPMLLAQHAGSSDFQWIDPFSSQQVLAFARVFFLVAAPALAAALIAVDALRHDRPGPRAVLDRIRGALADRGVAALAALATFPVALVAVSLLVQPSMLDRYAITTLLCWAPLVALAIEPLNRAAQAIALVTLLVPVGPNVKETIAVRQGFANDVARDSISYESARRLGVPVVFPWFHVLYPVVAPRRSEPTPARFLVIPDSLLQQLYPGDRLEWLRRRIRVENASAISHQRVYGFPAVVTATEMDTVKRFAVIAYDLRMRGGSRQAEYWARVVFPRHQYVRIDDHLWFLERTK